MPQRSFPSTPSCRSARSAATAPGWWTRTATSGSTPTAATPWRPPGTAIPTWCAPSPSRRRSSCSTRPPCRCRSASSLAEKLAALCPAPLGAGLLLQLGRGGQRERAAPGAAAHRAADDRLGARRMARPHRRDARVHRRGALRGGGARRAGIPLSAGRCRSTTSPRSTRRWTTRSPRCIVEPVQGFAGARDCSLEFLAGRPPRLHDERGAVAALRRGPVRRGPLRRVQRGRGGRRDARRADASPRDSPPACPIGAVVATPAAHRRRSPSATSAAPSAAGRCPAPRRSPTSM